MAHFCPNCGDPVRSTDKFCPNCGYPLSDLNFQSNTRTQTMGNAQAQYQESYQDPVEIFNEEEDIYEDEYEDDEFYDERMDWPVKNRYLAGILAIICGDFGVHKFYLGKIRDGVISVLFFWTGIPALIGLIEGILYLVQSDEEFSEKNKVRVDNRF